MARKKSWLLKLVESVEKGWWIGRIGIRAPIIRRLFQCPRCKGSMKVLSEGQWDNCPLCEGEGVVHLPELEKWKQEHDQEVQERFNSCG